MSLDMTNKTRQYQFTSIYTLVARSVQSKEHLKRGMSSDSLFGKSYSMLQLKYA